MAKLSKRISSNLKNAVKKASEELGVESTEENSQEISEETESSVEELLQSGVKAAKKRKAKSSEEKEPVEMVPMKTYEQICEEDLAKAQAKGLPDPDFDFRNYYVQGTNKWYVRVLPTLGEKSIHEVFLRTIYPRMIVGSEQKSGCHCIGYKERDCLFGSYLDAKRFFDSIDMESKASESIISNDSDISEENPTDNNEINSEATQEVSE